MRKRIADDVRRAIRQRDRVLRTLAASESSVEIGRREVEVAASGANRVQVTRGVAVGDRIVSEGVLLLRARETDGSSE